MANPEKPALDYSYTGFQQSQGDASFPGTPLDNDLANLKQSIDETIDALSDVRRSDGTINNEIVTFDSLSPDLKAKWQVGAVASEPVDPAKVYAGPTAGADALPTFRPLQSTDVPFAATTADVAVVASDIAAVAADTESLINGSGGGNVDLRMFGADPTGVADSAQAFRDALAFMKAQGLRNIVGRGTYRFASSVDVSNISTTGINVHIERVVADSAWPAIPQTPGFTSLPQWRNATPVFDIGTSGGSMVNHFWYIGSFDGADKADLFKVNRCGGSTFWVGYATNFNILHKHVGVNGNVASNILDGNYAQNGNLFAYIRATSPFVAEAVEIKTSFIQNCVYGGAIFGDNARYPNIAKGQLDFNGRNLVELTLNASASAWAEGAVVTGGTSGTKGDVITTYSDGGVFKALVLRDVNAEGSPGFTAETVTDGTTSRTISATRTTTEGYSTFYFDLIIADRASGFSRGYFDAPYLGGFVGNGLSSMKIGWGNSNNSSITWMNGLGFTSSPTQSLVYSHVDGVSTPGSPFLNVTADLFAPRRDVFLGDSGPWRIYSSDSQITMSQNTWATMFDLSGLGANDFGRAYDLNIWRIAATSHHAKLHITVDSTGAASLQDMGSVGFSFQVTVDNKIQAMQADFATLTVRRTLLRVG